MSELARRIIANNIRTKSKILNLIRCNIETLPEELSECVWLEVLDIQRNNAINDLSVISGLVNLRKLILHDTQVNDLTPISKLIRLEYLGCSGT